jgi:ribosomal protein L11 methyltransferase
MAYYELKITSIPEARQPVMRLLTEKGSMGFLEEDRFLTAYFPGTSNIQEIVRELEIMKPLLDQAGFGHGMEFSYALLPDQDWNENWKKNFTAIDAGTRFTILPPWEERHRGRINLIIDPGMAFGTGHHETTRSCLVLMEKYDGKVPRHRFLDLGTGTGLLAIAAVKLGYREVVAIDTDPLATEAARMNSGLNQAGTIEIREGSIDAASGTFDCIAANIISGVLVLLAPEIAARLKPAGISILSGILAEQADEVVEAYERAGLTLVEKFPDNKWISLVLQK